MNSFNRRTLLGGVAGLAGATLLAHRTAAQSYPQRPVRLIVPYAPGGGTDVFSRLLASQIEKELGQTLVIDNRAGGASVIGTQAVASAQPDGYTIGMMDSAFFTNPGLLKDKLPYDTRKDFITISLLSRTQLVLCVHPSSPFKTAKDLVDHAKANPGKLTFASAGIGTGIHLAGEQFRQVTGTEFLVVPYRGGAPALQDLLAGQVDMLYDNLPGVIGQVRAGKVQPLAVTTRQPAPQLPDIPPMVKFLPDFEITSWGGMCGPAGLPPAMVEKANALCKQALGSEKVKATFAQQGATAIWNTPADSAKFRADNEARLAPIIKASGARVE